MWSCPPQAFFDFPMRFVVQFFENHGMLALTGLPTWRVIEGGSARYLDPLVESYRDRIRLRTKIVSIRRHPDRVDVATESGVETFDQVVIACHSDQALAMLADPSALEREVLGAIPYQTNDVIVHTDVSLLPRARRAWASWNYFIPAEDRDRVILTYDMNILQGLRAPRTVCVTVNDDGRVDPAQILHRVRYHHPVFRLDTPRMQAMHERLIHHQRTSYCGAYWGFGFHEDGVASALAVARGFGLSLWITQSRLYRGWVRHRRHAPRRATPFATACSSATSGSTPFAERYLGDVQMLLTRPACRRAPILPAL
jgi:predicted NAD/FAD-binding protein